MPRITQAVLRLANVLLDKLERTAGFVNHSWKRNPSWNYETILQLAKAHEGEDRVLAERFFNEAENNGWLSIKRHRYSSIPEKIALICENDVAKYDTLYTLTGRTSPRERRLALAQMFMDYDTLDLSHSAYQSSWQLFCNRYAAQLTSLDETKLLCRGLNLIQTENLLNDLSQLLQASQELHIREASTVYLGDSKKLELNQSIYLKWLTEITEGCITSFDDIGVQDKHRTITLWGPWILTFDSAKPEQMVCDLSHFELPVRISQRDILSASISQPDIPVITVENKESLDNFALTKPNALLISSGELGGFSHSAVIDFIQSLPSSVRLFHWGDADPAGFSILASLRERTGRSIDSLAMEFIPEHSTNTDSPQNLTTLEQKEIARLLESTSITHTEANTLRAMLEADSKGNFEQEGRTFPLLIKDTKDL